MTVTFSRRTNLFLNREFGAIFANLGQINFLFESKNPALSGTLWFPVSL